MRAGTPDVYNGSLHRVVGGRDTVLRRGVDFATPIWVDGGRTLVQQPDGKLVLLRTSRRDAPHVQRRRRRPRGRLPGEEPGRPALDGLDVYDTGSGARVRSFHLRSMPRSLVDVQSGIAVLLSGGQIHLLKLDTGRGATVVPPRGGPLLAQLEPAGLFYSAGARIFFLPLEVVLGRFR